MTEAEVERPQLRTADTLDRAPQLSGTLAEDGVMRLTAISEAVQMNGHADPGSDTGESVVTDDAEVENYDTQKLDPHAIIKASRGGDLPLKLNTEVADANGKLAPDSIPVRLEKTDKRGRYRLRPDDPEIRDIIKIGIDHAKDTNLSTKRRTGFKDLVFTRRFTTFDRQNPLASDSPFYGFFVLFWLMMAFMIVRVSAQNWRKYGSVLGSNELGEMMFSRDVVVLGLTDGVGFVLTGFGLLLQKALVKGWIKWNNTGMIIQNIWQTSYLFGLIGWTFYREWPWTHTVFLVLHTIVFLMKQHSYAFYNGYLSQCYWRKKRLERKLQQLKLTSPVPTPTTTTPSRTFSNIGTTSRPSSPRDADSFLRQRRVSSRGKHSNMSKEPPEISDIAQAIASGDPLDGDQLEFFAKMITSEIDALDAELKGKCSVTSNHYPNNLTVANWAEYICLPTLVYELEYPRQETRSWSYIAEKTAATFGCIFLMMVVSQAYIYPTMAEAWAMRERGLSAAERWSELPWVISDLLFPLLLEQLLTWYVIWECILNVLAEVTKFADRGFYGPWWNSVSWDQYARDWNRPVHTFLLRHVYHSSISALHLNKSAATFVTFFLSALVHELVMFCLFKKLRGYLFAMQLMQIPLAMVARTPLLKGRNLLGNVIFWTGLFVGPSALSAMYLIS